MNWKWDDKAPHVDQKAVIKNFTAKTNEKIESPACIVKSDRIIAAIKGEFQTLDPFQ